MNYLKSTLLLSAVSLTLVTGLSAAQAQTATVDLKKLFDNYWKTKQADAALKDRGGELDKKRKDMIEDAKKLQDEYNKLLETANDQAVSSEERKKRKDGAEKKLLDLRELETTLGQFDRSARTQLAEEQRRMRDKIIAELRDAINSKSKAGGFQMVFDASAETANGTPALLYSAGLTDITDDVLKQLNSTEPPAPKPSDTKPTPDGKK